MDLPQILAAEAGVKSNRATFKSLFDPNVDIHTENIKEFYADPTLMKKAILQLKKAGFTVLASNKVSIELAGPTYLFEEQFAIEIIVTEEGITCANCEVFGFIDTSKSPFADVLTGISLTQAMTISGADPPDKKHSLQLQLWEIPLELNSGKENVQQLLGDAMQNRVKIAVLDSGFDIKHPYFKADNHRQLGKAKIKIIDSALQEYRKSLKHKHDLIDDFVIEAKAISTKSQLDAKYDLTNDLNDLVAQAKTILLPWEIREFGDPSYDLQNVRDSLVKIQENVNNISFEFRKLLHDDDATHSHGTGIMAILLKFIRDMNTNVDVIKTWQHFSSNIAYSLSEVLTANNSPDIVMTSLGSLVDENWTFDNFREDNATINPIVSKIKQLGQKGIIFILAAGNKDKTKDTRRRVLECQLPYPISVGGAYYGKEVGEQAIKLKASDKADGYESSIFPNRIVPDVCGLVGPVGVIMHILPKAGGEDWDDFDGTSFAAPQIAGLCALIKAKYPGVTPQEMKEILVRTSRPTEDGKTSQGKQLNQLEIKYGDDTFSPGLVQIKNALLVADWLNVFSVIPDKLTVKEAVHHARHDFIDDKI